MRIFTTAALGVFMTAAVAAHAAAQTTDRAYFSLSGGGQSREQTFTTSSTFPIYLEQGASAAGHSIGGGTLFDVSAGYRVWRDLTVGIAYSTVKNKNDVTARVRVPHPLLFGQSREATATVEDLVHSENVVHLQFGWTVPVTSKISVALRAGPSFFTVRQDIASVRRQDIRDVAPFTSVSITNVTVTEVKDSPVGFNIGLDATYMITRAGRLGVGVGGFARYTQASLDLPTPDFAAPDTLTLDATDLKAGGGQAGLGLRLRF